jgi:ornithine cyclodeaminase/alanine dehydrogenase-like protein (mu-crystallin family)
MATVDTMTDKIQALESSIDSLAAVGPGALVSSAGQDVDGKADTDRAATAAVDDMADRPAQEHGEFSDDVGAGGNSQDSAAGADAL